MHAMEIQEHARKMLATFGDKAMAEVAQKAARLEQDGDFEHAKEWRRIEQAMQQMRGPRSS